MSENYEWELSVDYEWELSVDYKWELSPSIYYHLVYHDDAEKLRFIGILAYPKRHCTFGIKSLFVKKNTQVYYL